MTPGSQFISVKNAFKIALKEAPSKRPTSAWQPMRCWPACPHPEQARIDAYNAYPSRSPHA